MLKGVFEKVWMEPPFSVTEYITANPNSMDTQLFDSMSDEGVVKELQEIHGLKSLTEIGGFLKR